MLNQWGFVKNIRAEARNFIAYIEAQRALQGKETVSYYGDIEITQERIENFKVRMPREIILPLNLGKLSYSPFYSSSHK